MGQVVSINAHRKKKKRNHNVRWTRIILACLIFALIGFGISQSPIFDVKSVDVSGNENIDTETILELSDIEIGQHIYSFSAGRAETMISTNPLVETVNVKRVFPNKVVISITERQALAAVEAEEGILVVDKEGYVLKKQQLFDGLKYMLITGVDDMFGYADENTADENALNETTENNIDVLKSEAEKPNDTEENNNTENDKTQENENSADSGNKEGQVFVTGKDRDYKQPQCYDDIKTGSRLKSEKLAVGLALITQMDEYAMETVTEINVSDSQNIVMGTVYGIKIYFGDENDIERKFEICNSILEEENESGSLTKIEYIDISVPEHPALKYNN